MKTKLQQTLSVGPENSDNTSDNIDNSKQASQTFKTKALIISDDKKVTNKLALTLSETCEIDTREDLKMIFQLFSDVKTEQIDTIIYYDSNPNKDLSIISMMKKYPRFSNIPIIVIAR